MRCFCHLFLACLHLLLQSSYGLTGPALLSIQHIRSFCSSPCRLLPFSIHHLQAWSRSKSQNIGSERALQIAPEISWGTYSWARARWQHCVAALNHSELCCYHLQCKSFKMDMHIRKEIDIRAYDKRSWLFACNISTLVLPCAGQGVDLMSQANSRQEIT